MMKATTLLLMAATLLTGNTALAQITVSRSVIEFTPDARIQDVEVTNTGDIKMYLDMKVAEILSPESAEPVRKELDDPRTSPVLVSPRQLLVPPGQRKRIRIIMREGSGEIDRVFRLAVKPYTGKVKLEAPGGDKKSSAIKVLVGYDLLLLSRPSQLRPDVDVTRTNDAIEFVNRGNTNVLLRKIQQCDAGESDCVDMQPNRLYAGETYRIDLPRKGSSEQYPVQVWRSVGLENSRADY